MTEYKRLGDYIRPVDVRNRDMASTPQAPHKYPTSTPQVGDINIKRTAQSEKPVENFKEQS
jgi:hypothetical protein